MDALEIGAAPRLGAGPRPGERGRHPSHRAASPASRLDRRGGKNRTSGWWMPSQSSRERTSRGRERRRRPRGHCRRGAAPSSQPGQQRDATLETGAVDQARRDGPAGRGSAAVASRRDVRSEVPWRGHDGSAGQGERPRCRDRRSSRESPPDGRRVPPMRRARGRSRPPRASVPVQSQHGENYALPHLSGYNVRLTMPASPLFQRRVPMSPVRSAGWLR